MQEVWAATGVLLYRSRRDDGCGRCSSCGSSRRRQCPVGVNGKNGYSSSAFVGSVKELAVIGDAQRVWRTAGRESARDRRQCPGAVVDAIRRDAAATAISHVEKLTRGIGNHGSGGGTGRVG